MSEDIEGIEKELEIELGRISVSSFGTEDADTEVSEEPLSDSETVSIPWAKSASLVCGVKAVRALETPSVSEHLPNTPNNEDFFWKVLLAVLLHENCNLQGWQDHKRDEY